MNNSLKHTFIIGMMGSGKTKIAHLLSKKLDTPYIDTDHDLVSILNLNMEEVFDHFSEKKFRVLESAYFIEHLKNNQHVYATGGGIILNKENRDAMRQYGRTILLTASTSTLFERLSNDKANIRPVFNKNKNKKFLDDMWHDRKKYYRECADFIVETDKKSENQIANEIIGLLQ